MGSNTMTIPKNWTNRNEFPDKSYRCKYNQRIALRGGQIYIITDERKLKPEIEG